MEKVREKVREKEAIRQWVWERREELLSDLEMLVEVPSVSDPESSVKPYGPGCREVLDKFLELGKTYGLYGRNCDYHVGSLSVKPTGEGDCQIAIWTHLDVVAAGDGWRYPPFQLSREGDFVIGRGIQDNKGSVAGALCALKYLKEHEEELGLKHNYTLYGGCSEENGMKDMAYFLKHEKPADVNLVADCVFPVGRGEKGILNITFQKILKRPGMIRGFSAGSSVNSIPQNAEMLLEDVREIRNILKDCAKDRVRVINQEGKICLQAEGRSGHVGFPEGAVNAIKVLTDFIIQTGIVKVLSEDEKALIEFLNCVNYDMHGTGAGIACEDEESGCVCGAVTMAAMTEDIVTMRADYRYPVSIKDGSGLAEILIKKAKAYGCDASMDQDDPPYYIPESDSLVKAVLSIYNQATETHGKAYTMSGGTYARKLPRAVSYGMSLENKKVFSEEDRPKGAGDCHQPDESLSVEQLLEAVVIYIITLIELDKEDF